MYPSKRTVMKRGKSRNGWTKKKQSGTRQARAREKTPGGRNGRNWLKRLFGVHGPLGESINNKNSPYSFADSNDEQNTEVLDHVGRIPSRRLLATWVPSTLENRSVPHL